MASANYKFRNVNQLPEAAHGSIVPATHYMVGDFTYTPEIDRYMSNYPRTVRAQVTGGGVDIRKGSLLTGTTELTFEELLYPLNCGLGGVVITGTLSGGGAITGITNVANAVVTFTTPPAAAVIGGWIVLAGVTPAAWNGSYLVTAIAGSTVTLNNLAGNGVWTSGGTATVAPFTHTCTPLMGADPNPRSFSAEFGVTDGTTPGYRGKFGYGLYSAFGVEFAFNQIARMTSSAFGRAKQTLAPVTTAAVMAFREPAASNRAQVSIDTSWANLGNTPVSTTVRAAKLDLMTGLMPDYTLDGRSDLDMTTYQYNDLTGTLALTFEHTPAALAEIGQWETHSLRFIRLRVVGSGSKAISLDGCFKYTKPPVFSFATGVEIVTLAAELEFDLTGTSAFRAIVTNGTGSLP